MPLLRVPHTTGMISCLVVLAIALVLVAVDTRGDRNGKSLTSRFA